MSKFKSYIKIWEWLEIFMKFHGKFKLRKYGKNNRKLRKKELFILRDADEANVLQLHIYQFNLISVLLYCSIVLFTAQ